MDKQVPGSYTPENDSRDETLRYFNTNIAFSDGSQKKNNMTGEEQGNASAGFTIPRKYTAMDRGCERAIKKDEHYAFMWSGVQDVNRV